MTEIYISTDIESDGPIPGPYSMLSFGSAAFLEDGTRVGTFTRNLELLPGASQHPDTMAWWSEPKQHQAWENARRTPVDPKVAMEDYVRWIEGLPGIEKSKNGSVKNVVFVGYPAGFDFMFVYYYLVYFTGGSPFSFSALDMKSFAMAVLGTTYRGTSKKTMPKKWFPPNRPHTHVALDDAIEQGELFINILKEASQRR
jgi:hypothetical protein